MISTIRRICNEYVVSRYTLHLYIGIEIPVTVHYLVAQRGREKFGCYGDVMLLAVCGPKKGVGRACVRPCVCV